MNDIDLDDIPPQVLARAFALIDRHIKRAELASGRRERITTVRAELQGHRLRVIAVSEHNFGFSEVLDLRAYGGRLRLQDRGLRNRLGSFVLSK